MKVPMVLSWDQSLRGLRLSRSLPRDLGDLNATSATGYEIAAAYKRKRELAGQAARVVLEHPSCLPGFVDEAERIEKYPAEVTRVEMPSAARCQDGWPSTSIGSRGACSHHGGVVPAQPWATLHFD